MRVVHWNLATEFGGGEVQTLNLIFWLSEQGVEQSLVSRKEYPFAKRVARNLSCVEILGLGECWGRLLGSSVQERDGLVLHAHDGRSLHQCALLGKLFKVPSLATRRVDKGVPKNLFSAYSYGQLDRLVAVSSRIQNRIEERLGEGRCLRIPDSFSGFPSDPARVAEIKDRFAGKRLIGQVGSLYAIKGHRYTIEVARELASKRPELHFVLLGDGDERADLEAQAAGLSNLTFAGFVEDVGNWLAAFDLLVQPSLREGLGSILLEAQQFGVPVIASDVGGIPDVVLHEQTGLLVPPCDSSALLQAILRLLDDDGLRVQLVMGAKDHLRNFTPERVGQAYLELYRELLSMG